MKHMSKILALVLALVMALSLATTAYAAEGDVTITVTTSDSGASVAKHTYDVYQIFTGDVAADGKTLSNAAFGENYKPADKTVAQAMDDLSKMSDAEAAAALEAAVTGNAVATLDDDNNHSAEVAPGYYLIVDVSTDLPEGETSSAFILQVLQSTEISSKHSTVPDVVKKIDDTNDSVDEENEIIWHDGADHDIGDSISFKLEMTIPAMIDRFKEYGEAYKFVFHDKEDEGLKFKPETVVVKIGDTTLVKGTDYTVAYPATDGDTFDVIFADLTKVAAAQAGAKVVVTYESELTEDAVFGAAGNVNEVYGEYSNLHRPEYPGFTPKDTAIAFTYKVNVDKYTTQGEDKVPLANAGFTLYKAVANTATADAQTGAAIKEALAASNPSIKAEALADDVYYITIAAVMTEGDGDTFGFPGVDDGNYVLVETTIPDGYNAWDSVAFTITADHDETADEPALKSLTGGDLVTGEFKDTGIITTDIINESGTILPETGGMGTTLFYAFGGLLVAAAVVLLVTKKRMASAE